MELQSILEAVAESAIKKQDPDGSLSGGENGPHSNPETPVRNTAHHLVLFSKLFEQTGDEKFRDAAYQATEYLETAEARPHGYTFDHRRGAADRCNGTIGQAWTIEAIAEAGRVLDIPGLIDIAEEVFLQHPFNERIGYWKRVEIDGEVLCFDTTFNHQLWFAAAGGLLAGHHDVDPKIDRQVRCFLNRCRMMMGQRESGLFDLLSKPPIRLYPYVGYADNRGRMLAVLLAFAVPFWDHQTIRELTLRVTPISKLPMSSDEYYERLVGYQSFHLYGFALLQEVYPNHELWDDTFIQRGMEHTETDRFVRDLEENLYGYPYNISGVEMAYAEQVFGENCTSVKEKWLSRQFEKCWDMETGMMSRNNPDPKTLTARLYEVARLDNLNLEVSF